MNSERFEALAEAFGGEVSRWPAAERDAAAAHVGVVRHEAVEEARYGGATDSLQSDRHDRARADIVVGEHRQDHRYARVGGGA